jgi:16S rRNA (cytosine967-C5)-methyltransferase
MRSHSYLNTAKKVIQSYDGSVPLAAFLKQFFKSDKKFGSKDRREITHVCFCFYRLGHAFQSTDLEERMLTGLFLCSDQPSLVFSELRPERNGNVSFALDEKLQILSANVEIQNIFPFTEALSRQIEPYSFNRSFLIQPNLYLRIRPGKKEKLVQKLQELSVPFRLLNTNCIELPNQVKVDEMVSVDEDAVIQDYNSQRVIEVIKNFKLQTSDSKLSVWDCCAASGGKSILFHDHFPRAHLTVSDVRESILINLQKRFRRAGITNYDHFVADIASPAFSVSKKFDLVICDAPCSGSGTWSRTPEQLHFFREEKIGYYADLQKRIVNNAAKALKQGGSLLYITCSVFEKENESVVDFIQQRLSLNLVQMQYLKGYDKKADTLFAALFTTS